MNYTTLKVSSKSETMETPLKSQGYGKYEFRRKGEWGSGGRWFKSSRPDQLKQGVTDYLWLLSYWERGFFNSTQEK
jgi:hypothetical protein